MNYYHNYRTSRKRKKARIRILIVTLVLVIVGIVAALFLLQDNMIFQSDGSWLSLPFLHRETAQQPSDPASDVPDEPDDIDLQIDDPQPQEQQQQQPDTIPAPEEPAPRPIAAAKLFSGDAILSGSANQLTAEAAVAVRVRSDGDEFLLPASEEHPVSGVSGKASSYADAVQKLSAPVAVFSALKDQIRPRGDYRSSALHTESGAVWLDWNYVSWLDPAGEQTAECLLSQIEACKAQGFSQAVLTNFQYPVQGKTALIHQPAGFSATDSLTALAKTLSEQTELPLGLVLTETAAKDLLDPASGQDVAALAPYFDVLYIPTATMDLDLSTLNNALEGTHCRVGFFLSGNPTVPENFALDYILAK